MRKVKPMAVVTHDIQTLSVYFYLVSIPYCGKKY